jgi:hypothetical protein
VILYARRAIYFLLGGSNHFTMDLRIDQTVAVLVLAASIVSLMIWTQTQQLRIRGEAASSIFKKTDAGNVPPPETQRKPSASAPGRAWFRTSLSAALLSALYLYFSR